MISARYAAKQPFTATGGMHDGSASYKMFSSCVETLVCALKKHRAGWGVGQGGAMLGHTADLKCYWRGDEPMLWPYQL